MANQIGKIPEFTQDEPQEVKPEEEQPQETLPLEEKTVEEPESSGEQEAVKPVDEAVSNEDAKAEVLKTQLQALEEQRKALLDDITDLRGQRRKLKETELGKVEDKIIQVQDDIKDINPDDIKVIDKINRSRGYITKEDVKKIFYEEVKQEVLNEFFDKYPEYKPENDPNDLKWNALQKELSWYKMPDNPRMIATLLERARKTITPANSEQSSATKKQLSTASIGSKGTQRSSPTQAIDPDLMAKLYGFDEEDIKKIAKRLNK